MKISQFFNKSNLILYLASHSLQTISLMEIERLLPGGVKYGDFVGVMEELMAEGVLVPIGAHGTNQANPPLPNGYRIKKQRLKAGFFEEIRSRQLFLHPRKDSKAYEEFCGCFSVADQQRIATLFAHQGYYPQEALSGRELQDMGRAICWKDI